jgi:hypothetical protein
MASARSAAVTHGIAPSTRNPGPSGRAVTRGVRCWPDVVSCETPIVRTASPLAAAGRYRRRTASASARTRSRTAASCWLKRKAVVRQAAARSSYPASRAAGSSPAPPNATGTPHRVAPAAAIAAHERAGQSVAVSAAWAPADKSAASPGGIEADMDHGSRRRCAKLSVDRPA